MSSLKLLISWPNLVQRQCGRLVNVYTMRNIHMMNSGATVKHLQTANCVWHKQSQRESSHVQLRSFSSKQDSTVIDNNKKKSQEKNILSFDEIQNVLSSGHVSKNLPPKTVTKTERHADTVEVPKDLTEEEFLEISHDSVCEKYAQMRLSKLSPEEEKRLKILKLLFDVIRSTGGETPPPEWMTGGRWLYLLVCKKGESNVKKQLAFWYKVEKTLAEKLERKQKKEIRIKDADYSQDLHNKITRRISDSLMNVHYFNNLAFSMQHGQPLIYDFGFADDMKVRELSKTVQQLKLSHSVNKVLTEPFHMHICGFPTEGKFFHMLKRKVNDILRPDLPVTFTTKDITELDYVPREKLVYLSPNSPYTLKRFNHDDVYVIGGIVDLGAELPLTYAKAKRLNIRSARLPLDRYITFQGGKALTLNHVIAILADLKKGLSMREAVISNVPIRKVKEVLDADAEDFNFVEHKLNAWKM